MKTYIVLASVIALEILREDSRRGGILMTRRKRWWPDSVSVLVAKATTLKWIIRFILDRFLAKTSVLVPFRRGGKQIAG